MTDQSSSQQPRPTRRDLGDDARARLSAREAISAFLGRISSLQDEVVRLRGHASHSLLSEAALHRLDTLKSAAMALEAERTRELPAQIAGQSRVVDV